MKTVVPLITCLFFLTGTAFAKDGADIPTSGLPLLATQDTPTGYGDATGGSQNAAGSELNALYGSISGGTLNLGITGNLEGNFNKMWIFIDAVAGGEAVLLNDNADGGFGEINNLAGLDFLGNTADHGLRFEVGGGYNGVNIFDLIDNTGSNILSGGGPGSLPILNGSASGVTVGWDNSNVLGVDGSSAAGASTATTGWEISIDMITFFGSTPSTVDVVAFVSSGDGTALSNQVLPGIGGGGNIGSPSGYIMGMVEVVPEPTSVSLLVLAGCFVTYLRRRRR